MRISSEYSFLPKCNVRLEYVHICTWLMEYEEETPCAVSCVISLRHVIQQCTLKETV